METANVNIVNVLDIMNYVDRLEAMHASSQYLKQNEGRSNYYSCYYVRRKFMFLIFNINIIKCYEIYI